MIGWQHVKDGLPISGPNDPKFDGVWYGLDCEVMDHNGTIDDSQFSACWVADENRTMVFYKGFDTTLQVMYWREKE